MKHLKTFENYEDNSQQSEPVWFEEYGTAYRRGSEGQIQSSGGEDADCPESCWGDIYGNVDGTGPEFKAKMKETFGEVTYDTAL